MSELSDLWDYRRRVSDIYTAARHGGSSVETWEKWRVQRDNLFATHPQSPIENTSEFKGLQYFPYHPRWRVEAALSSFASPPLDVGHSVEGTTRFIPFGRLEFAIDGLDLTLTLLWLDSYGGGVFLPFRDLTNGTSTYGGGRYLLDSAKGADLGKAGDRVILDFNYAYHPSCVHSERWSCPLAPPENRLDLAVEAGERLPV